jgi:hypothetical protein
MFDKSHKSVMDALTKQSGTLTPAQEAKFMTAWKAGKLSKMMSADYKVLSASYFKIKDVIQPEPSWDVSRIKNISDGKYLTYMKNLWVKGKAKLIGGLGSDKPLTGDIDMQSNPFTKAKFKGVMKNLGYEMNVDKGVDWHFTQKSGEMVTQYGGTSFSNYHYASGGEGIRWHEQLTRLVHSGWNPAHIGRIKDIAESIRMTGKIFPEGLPKSVGMNMEQYTALKTFGYSDIMSKGASKLYYGPTLSDIGKEIQTSFYQKAFNPYFKHLAKGMELPSAKWSFTYESLPPTINYQPSSILSPFQMSTALAPSTSFTLPTKSYAISTNKSSNLKYNSIRNTPIKSFVPKSSSSTISNSINKSLSNSTNSKRSSSISPSISPSVSFKSSSYGSKSYSTPY